jgi:hypothetical protein
MFAARHTGLSPRWHGWRIARAQHTGDPPGDSRGSGGGCTDHPLGSSDSRYLHRFSWSYTVTCWHRERFLFRADASAVVASLVNSLALALAVALSRRFLFVLTPWPVDDGASDDPSSVAVWGEAAPVGPVSDAAPSPFTLSGESAMLLTVSGSQALSAARTGVGGMHLQRQCFFFFFFFCVTVKLCDCELCVFRCWLCSRASPSGSSRSKRSAAGLS